MSYRQHNNYPRHTKEKSLGILRYLNVPFSQRGKCSNLGGEYDSNRQKWYIPKGHEHPEVFDKWTRPAIVLTVPYEEREACKERGGHWDRLIKRWVVYRGIPISPFKKWMKKKKVKYSCNHRCIDKNDCAHDCCKKTIGTLPLEDDDQYWDEDDYYAEDHWDESEENEDDRDFIVSDSDSSLLDTTSSDDEDDEEDDGQGDSSDEEGDDDDDDEDEDEDEEVMRKRKRHDEDDDEVMEIKKKKKSESDSNHRICWDFLEHGYCPVQGCKYVHSRY